MTKNTPFLVFQGLLLGCLLIAGLGFFVNLPVEALAWDGANPDQGAATQDEAPKDESLAVQPDCSLSMKFPSRVRRWCADILPLAKQTGLPPNLVAAVIWQESGGNPRAYSSSGAVGLMQIMPSDGTARKFQCASGPCFANRPTMNKLYDPEFNLKFGTRMLAGLFKRHGSWREALKAYGPMDVGYSYADRILKLYQVTE